MLSSLQDLIKWQRHYVNWKPRFFLPSPHTVNVMGLSQGHGTSWRQLQDPAGPNLWKVLRPCQLYQIPPGKHQARGVGENPLKGRPHLKAQNANVELSASNLKIWLKETEADLGNSSPWLAPTARQKTSLLESRCQYSSSKKSAQSSRACIALHLGRNLVWIWAAF